MDESQIAQRDTQRRRDEVERLIEWMDLDEEEEDVVDADAELRDARVLPGVEQAVQYQRLFQRADNRRVGQRIERIGLASWRLFHPRSQRTDNCPFRPVDQRTDHPAHRDADSSALSVNVLDGRRENQLTVAEPLFQ